MQSNISCPHFDLKKIQTSRYHDVYSSLNRYDFKFERIVSTVGDVLGYELLLDVAKTKSNANVIECIVQYKKAIDDASAIDFAIERLARSALTITAKRIFLNFERAHLCHRQLLAKIALLSKELFLSNIELVLEITERDICGKCEQIHNGLKFLRASGVSLAVDDFDIYKGDFRSNEVLSGMYDYIKVEVPKTVMERDIFNAFARNSFFINKSIIVERVERVEMLQGLVNPFGVQGYAYNQLSGSPLS